MEQRTLELNVISANNLKDVNLVTKMDVYAVVSISGDSSKPKQNAKTNVHHGSGTNPTWNFPVRFTIDESLAQNNRLTLVLRLVCERSLGNKDVGEVNVPVKELLASMNDGSSNNNNNSMTFVTYQVRKPSGKAKGELHFSYKFVENVAGNPAAEKPVTTYKAAPVAVGPSYPPPPRGDYDHVQPVTGYAGGYPPPPTPGGYDHAKPVTGYAGGYPPPYGGVGYAPPPPPQGYGYPPPTPPMGYGYSPAPGYGYGYPQPQQVPRKSNKFGMGLGAGLIGGAIGGLLIGDMVSDVAAYDAGYDAGFGDAGGFDF